MKRLVVLYDGGLLKYASRSAASARLGHSYDTPPQELAADLRFKGALYDCMTTILRSKLLNIEQNFAKIDRCIICNDIGNSWRTKVTKTIIPGTEQASSIDYKGHRRTDDPEELAGLEKLNAIHKDTVTFICDNSGIEQVGYQSYEADDFMVVLSQTYAKQGDFVVIVANDADITQAVASTESGGYVMIMQPKQGSTNFVVDHATHNKTSEMSIFSMAEFPIGLAQTINNAQVLAPQYMLLEKVLNGDVSDDISPVMSRVVNNKRYKLTQKNLQTIFEHFVNKNTCKYFTIENMYNDEDVLDILRLTHQCVHKQSFDDLPQEWKDFYLSKYLENRKMVVINKAELGPIYNDVLQQAVKQLHGTTPTIAFPTWDVLQKLNM